MLAHCELRHNVVVPLHDVGMLHSLCLCGRRLSAVSLPPNCCVKYEGAVALHSKYLCVSRRRVWHAALAALRATQSLPVPACWYYVNLKVWVQRGTQVVVEDAS